MVDRSRSDVSVEAKLQEMIRAVEGELAAQRDDDFDAWYRLGPGQQVGRQSTDQIYSFPAGGNCSVSRGTIVQLASKRGATSARVLASDGRLILRCFDDLGTTIPSARIRWDSSWLLMELKRALEDLSPVGRLPRLLLEPRRTATALADLSEPAERPTRELNDDQREAVRRAMASELSLLWGPPGTGKTTTLASLAEAWYHEGKTLLVAAPSNGAVDKLLLAIAERLESELSDRRILRVGSITSGELRRRYGQYVDLNRLSDQGDDTEASSADLADAIREVLGRQTTAAAPREGTSELVGGSELHDTLTSDLAQLRQNQTGDLQEAEVLRRDLLSRARIVATTLTRGYLPGQLERQFDGLIVDEVSAAAPPALFAAADRATEHLVVSGDPRQLPPIIHARAPEVRRWMGRDVFDIGGVIPQRPGSELPGCLSVLTTQHRMHPVIGAAVSELAYGKRLTTAPSRPEAAVRPRAFDGEPLVLVDTSGLPPYLALRDVSKNGWSERCQRSNPLHRIVISQILEEAIGEQAERGDHAPDVALLTPYRQQEAYLREGFGHRHPVTVSTVHRAQGKEYETVILDLPERNSVPLSPFMRAQSLKDEGARLLNVASSRAKEQLIVLANVDYFQQQQQTARSACRFLSVVSRHATSVLPAEEVLEWQELAHHL